MKLTDHSGASVQVADIQAALYFPEQAVSAAAAAVSLLQDPLAGPEPPLHLSQTPSRWIALSVQHAGALAACGHTAAATTAACLLYTSPSPRD